MGYTHKKFKVLKGMYLFQILQDNSISKMDYFIGYNVWKQYD